MKSKIVIYWDYTKYGLVSYVEGLQLQEYGKPFSTNVLQFFTYENDVIIKKLDGSYIDVNEIKLNDGRYTDKEIRKEHNILKILLAGGFKWQPFQSTKML